MIPKIIHHIWVGDKPLPYRAAGYISNAKVILKDFEFKLWNEENIDFSNKFVSYCYEKKKWAFVSDYLRFKILFEYGGIYLDTDMEVLKDFTPLLNSNCFAGLNKEGTAIYCGIIGASRHNTFLSKVLMAYDHTKLTDLPTSPEIFTRTFLETSGRNLDIYPYQNFYPIQEGECIRLSKINQAYTNHHWDESWRKFVFVRRIFRRLGIVSLYHKCTKKKGCIVANVDN